MADNVYVHYSGATDVTAKKLMEALKAKGGINKPAVGKADIVIGWGAKTKGKTDLGQAKVLNHPDEIQSNRNKFKTLQVLDAGGCAVAKYATAKDVITSLKDGVLSLPLVGRQNYHQGGKGFWLCITRGHVEKAMLGDNGAQYFQNFIPIKDEFRLHIFDDKCIYAVRKAERENMQEAFVEQQGEKVENVAIKKKVDLDKATVQFVLEQLGKREEHPDQIIKSNLRGWKFVRVNNPNAELIAEAVKALKATGLTFGAVDCCLDEDNKPWIIEINSGPGLQGATFDAWVEHFKTVINEILAPPGVEKAQEAAPGKIQKAAPVKKAPKKMTKAEIKQRLAIVQDMIDIADEEDAPIIAKNAAKLLGN